MPLRRVLDNRRKTMLVDSLNTMLTKIILPWISHVDLLSLLKIGRLTMMLKLRHCSCRRTSARLGVQPPYAFSYFPPPRWPLPIYIRSLASMSRRPTTALGQPNCPLKCSIQSSIQSSWEWTGKPRDSVITSQVRFPWNIITNPNAQG